MAPRWISPAQYLDLSKDLPERRRCASDALKKKAGTKRPRLK